jgi:hypothetical protein
MCAPKHNNELGKKRMVDSGAVPMKSSMTGSLISQFVVVSESHAFSVVIASHDGVGVDGV